MSGLSGRRGGRAKRSHKFAMCVLALAASAGACAELPLCQQTAEGMPLSSWAAGDPASGRAPAWLVPAGHDHDHDGSTVTMATPDAADTADAPHVADARHAADAPEAAAGNANRPVIIDDRLLSVPDLPADTVAFNPSLCRTADGWVMAVRLEHRPPGQPPTSNQMAIVSLDAQWMPQGPLSILVPPRQPLPSARTEDPRLFVYRQQLHVVYNQSLGHKDSSPRSMQLARLQAHDSPQGRRFSIADDRRLLIAMSDGRPARTAKNWSPWVADGQLYFVHQSDPLRVAKIADAQIDGGQPRVWLQEQAVVTGAVPWDYGDIRGGTPVVQMPSSQRFLTFFHSSRKCHMPGEDAPRRQYFTGAYVLRGPNPFVVERSIVAPLTTADSLRDLIQDKRAVTFAAGLSMADDGQHAYVSYGRQDSAAALMTVDLDALQTWLQPTGFEQLPSRVPPPIVRDPAWR